MAPDKQKTLIGSAILSMGLVVIVTFVVMEIRAQDRRETCAKILKQIAIAMRAYAYEDRFEKWPLPALGRLAVAAEVRPTIEERAARIKTLQGDASWVAHLADIGWSVETVSEHLFNKDYYYLGCAVENEKRLEQFAQYYRTALKSGIRLDDDLADPIGSKDRNDVVVWRLREGIERAFITERGNPGASARVQAQLPILIERVGNHWPRGANVLYLDGHVEFIRYPGKWPMTKKTLRILNELDALGAQN